MIIFYKKTILTVLFIASFIVLNAQEKESVTALQYLPAQVYGGKVELKRFIQQEMNYPQKALSEKTEGIVEVAALVDLKGIYSDLHVKESISPELDAEAKRLYKMLLFVPSTFLGGNIKRYSTVKFKFSIKSYKKYCKKRGYDKIEIDTATQMHVYNENQVKIKPQIIFEDSMDNISSFINQNLTYPEGTLKLNITGVVKIYFVVEPSGRITNLKVLKGVGGGATNEAIRLLKLLIGKLEKLKVKK